MTTLRVHRSKIVTRPQCYTKAKKHLKGQGEGRQRKTDQTLVSIRNNNKTPLFFSQNNIPKPQSPHLINPLLPYLPSQQTLIDVGSGDVLLQSSVRYIPPPPPPPPPPVSILFSSPCGPGVRRRFVLRNTARNVSVSAIWNTSRPRRECGPRPGYKWLSSGRSGSTAVSVVEDKSWPSSSSSSSSSS